jgi:hypothetical protein
MPAGLTIDTDASVGPKKTSPLKLTPDEEAARVMALYKAVDKLEDDIFVLRHHKTNPELLEKKVEQLKAARRGSYFKAGRTRKHKRKTRRTKKRRV